jgi:hypothetical protein
VAAQRLLPEAIGGATFGAASPCSQLLVRKIARALVAEQDRRRPRADPGLTQAASAIYDVRRRS